MFKKIALLCVMGLALIGGQAYALTPAEKKAAVEAVKKEKELAAMQKKLAELYPATKVTSIRHTPVEGIFEVVAGKNLLYIEKHGRYFIFGSIYDMKNQHDLSADRREELNVVDISKLPVADAIKSVRGKGEHKLFVFSDPECPFCKRAEEALKDVDNVTIYVFMMPIPQLHPTAAKLSENIWCAEDKAKAWSDWMLNGIQPADKSCDNPIARNQALGSSMSINGTPTFIREDGRLMSGAPAGKDHINDYFVK